MKNFCKKQHASTQRFHFTFAFIPLQKLSSLANSSYSPAAHIRRRRGKREELGLFLPAERPSFLPADAIYFACFNCLSPLFCFNIVPPPRMKVNCVAIKTLNMECGTRQVKDERKEDGDGGRVLSSNEGGAV